MAAPRTLSGEPAREGLPVTIRFGRTPRSERPVRVGQFLTRSGPAGGGGPIVRQLAQGVVDAQSHYCPPRHRRRVEGDIIARVERMRVGTAPHRGDWQHLYRPSAYCLCSHPSTRRLSQMYQGMATSQPARSSGRWRTVPSTTSTLLAEAVTGVPD